LALSNYVSECQKDKCKGVGKFATKLVDMATYLEITKKRGRERSSAPKVLSFDENIAKIGPADPEIICLEENIKKAKDKKVEINASKIYSPVSNLVEWAKLKMRGKA